MCQLVTWHLVIIYSSWIQVTKAKFHLNFQEKKGGGIMRWTPGKNAVWPSPIWATWVAAGGDPPCCLTCGSTPPVPTNQGPRCEEDGSFHCPWDPDSNGEDQKIDHNGGSSRFPERHTHCGPSSLWKLKNESWKEWGNSVSQLAKLLDLSWSI